MDLLLIVLGLGLLGGIGIALVIARATTAAQDDRRLAPPSTGMINMARIRIEGPGGFGMVAMAICVASFVPRIRTTMEIAAVLGVLLAIVLIVWRRRHDPLPSAGVAPGAHAMLPHA